MPGSVGKYIALQRIALHHIAMQYIALYYINVWLSLIIAEFVQLEDLFPR